MQGARTLSSTGPNRGKSPHCPTARWFPLQVTLLASCPWRMRVNRDLAAGLVLTLISPDQSLCRVIVMSMALAFAPGESTASHHASWVAGDEVYQQPIDSADPIGDAVTRPDPEPVAATVRPPRPRHDRALPLEY
ncbi:hypothetical protein GCM10010372_05810 [Streptomyces tauricus]|nr:hypothetical protein GCM10010372_05810 [Streptomyces tauricus]